MPFKKILVAVDGEPIAAHAVDVAAELAGFAGAELAFIHVIEPELVNAADTGVQPATLEAAARDEAHKLIDDFRSHLSLNSPILEFVEIGSAATEVVRAAKDWPADLIVVGSHGRGGLRRALLGSVAEAVMRQASCPVLVVRGKE
ncbi:MAG: universal stress protein [Alphaproteobacteria bacterium]|nr:universal stress protein [Alphaproteobacteria bacterium]MBV8408651.1 universal stress protein [Alphaproteobacteria bacterium]